MAVLKCNSNGMFSDHGIHLSSMLLSLISELANTSNKYTKYFSTAKTNKLVVKRCLDYQIAKA